MTIKENIKNSEGEWITLREIADSQNDTLIYGRLATNNSVYANNLGEKTLYDISSQKSNGSYTLILKETGV